MERLSKWNGEKFVLPQGRWRDIADRLGDYEETGLEPEEISAILNGAVLSKDRNCTVNGLSKADIIEVLTIFKNISDKRYSDAFAASIVAVNEYGRGIVGRK